MKRLIILTGVILIVYLGVDMGRELLQPNDAQPNKIITESSTISEAFTNQVSDIQVKGYGTVERILKDDTKGSRHQRFILRLPSGQTLLVSHNIDIALRIVDLHEGDSISFNGEYEWNEQGGVIHWTHHDPNGTHAEGWLMHKGKTYQ